MRKRTENRDKEDMFTEPDHEVWDLILPFQSKELACYFSRDAGRRLETPGSEKKGLTSSTARSMIIYRFALHSQEDDTEGLDGWLHRR